MSKETIEILTNKEVIAVDQDSLGVQGFRYNDNGPVEVWVKPLSKGDWAVCFLNRSDKTVKFEFDWSKHNIYDGQSNTKIDNALVYQVRDLWKKKNIGDTKKKIVAEIASHDVMMVRLSK